MARKRRHSGTPRRGAISADTVYPTLDLHGETAESARLRAERWLRAQRSGGERVVRVITGRGLHSPGPPVLPGEIADLLHSLRGSLVAGFELERGGGVYRVELRRPAPVRPSRPPPRPDDIEDSDLRHRAEEALAELGIRPDPALLSAEIRRLRRERGREQK